MSVIQRHYHVYKTFMSYVGIWPDQSKTVRMLILSGIVLINISFVVPEWMIMSLLENSLLRRSVAYLDHKVSIDLLLGCYKHKERQRGDNRRLPMKIGLKAQIIPSINLNNYDIARVFDTWSDVDIIVECITSMIIVIISNTKLLNLSFKINTVRNLFSLIEYHWQLFNNITEVKILQNYAIFGTKIIISFAIYVCIALIIFMTMTTVPQFLDFIMPLNESRPRKFVVEAEYYIDRDKYYYPILLHSYVGITVILLVAVCADSVYIACVQHSCSLFAAIGDQLEHTASEEYSDKTNCFTKREKKKCEHKGENDIYFKEEAITREFIICLRKHQLAVQYACLVESSFTLSTGIQLISTMFGMSFTGILLISNLDKFEDVIRYTSFSFGMLIHLLWISIPGQRFLDHSADVFDKVSRSHWYIFSLKSKKLLRMLLYRCYTPCTLTAGKICVMSMANFSTVVQRALSYFMAISSMK